MNLIVLDDGAADLSDPATGKGEGPRYDARTLVLRQSRRESSFPSRPKGPAYPSRVQGELHLFETMVLRGLLTGKTKRYATWETVKQGHVATRARAELALNGPP